MTVLLVSIRSHGAGGIPEPIRPYVERISRYAKCEYREQSSEQSLFTWLARLGGRTQPFIVLTDSRGEQVSSREFAAALGQVRDRGIQQVVLAVGPADGWSAEALKRADLTVAFGRITLPHELAAVVLAEQVYRAMTILAGHPYHTGH